MALRSISPNWINPKTIVCIWLFVNSVRLTFTLISSPTIEMGQVFEELIRRFNEASNEEAGDHFTPREVIRLMVDLIFDPDDKVLTTPGIVKTLYDPACGTGGMLSVAEEYLNELEPGL